MHTILYYVFNFNLIHFIQSYKYDKVIRSLFQARDRTCALQKSFLIFTVWCPCCYKETEINIKKRLLERERPFTALIRDSVKKPSKKLYGKIAVVFKKGICQEAYFKNIPIKIWNSFYSLQIIVQCL